LFTVRQWSYCLVAAIKMPPQNWRGSKNILIK
jgi:hypothetical protein